MSETPPPTIEAFWTDEYGQNHLESLEAGKEHFFRITGMTEYANQTILIKLSNGLTGPGRLDDEFEIGINAEGDSYELPGTNPPYWMGYWWMLPAMGWEQVVVTHEGLPNGGFTVAVDL